MESYGKELILDLRKCNPSTFTRKHIKNYLKDICFLINMERASLHWWDDLYTPKGEKQTAPHLKGTTVIQFMLTSNITIHTLDILEKVFINIFSCKNFNPKVAEEFSVKFFKGQLVKSTFIERL